ncbi:MAG: galactosyltransferase-related protein [Candidatus Heimdallarchaeaceae archaeon]
MSDVVTFIVPCRGRTEHLPGLLQNLERVTCSYKVMLCEQADNLLFRKGQLSNLGFKRAKSNIVAFINLDYRFLERIDLIAELKKAGKPIVPFLYATRVTEKNGVITEHSKRGISGCPGGCQVFTKDQFIKCGGHTNLILGWGSDDVTLALRAKSAGIPFVHLPYTMGHVIHSKQDGYVGRARMKELNRTVCIRYPDPEYDSFKETIADEVDHKIMTPIVEKYRFTNIRVPDDYKEMKRYRIQLTYERSILKL